ncbi:MAG: glycoside hydrolase family 3 N-terminal domain-containing protein [Patescibacteria group bacterium]
MPLFHNQPYLRTLLLCAGILAAAALVFFRNSPPPLDDAVYMDASLPLDARVADLLARMTLEEKIGQMALVEKNSMPLHDVSKYGIGAVVSGGGGKPDENTPEGWRAMIDSFLAESKASRTGIPILYGVDANHGQGNVPGATIFPHQIGLGAARDASLVERIARATAEESRALGTSWIFSPSLDLPTDIRWGRVYEAFSSDAQVTMELGAAFVRGLENDPSLLATPKHFVGAGSMQWGSSSNKNFSIDQGATPADETALRAFYLPPFRSAIESGAEAIMMGLNSWGDAKVSASRYLITDVLKGELGFTGFVVSDWYGVYEISPNKHDSTVAAINAGVDMVMLPYEYKLFVRDVRHAVRRGDITQARVDDAAERILRVKFELGLFDGQLSAGGEIGTPAHRALAREAVARSLVVLKNDDVLPLPNNLRKIRVAGSAADNIGMQVGAWTVEWQGIDGNWLPGATSILAGIRAAASSTDVQYAKDGRFAEKDIADIGIAVVGEKPYAEGWGDNANPRLTDDDLAAIRNLQGSAREILVIIVSGRPLIITEELPNWDALIAAWLPGSEGAGVADILFGTATTTGELPLPWPRSIEQLPFDLAGFSKGGTPPLFPIGFGLPLTPER